MLFHFLSEFFGVEGEKFVDNYIKTEKNSLMFRHRIKVVFITASLFDGEKLNCFGISKVKIEKY